MSHSASGTPCSPRPRVGLEQLAHRRPPPQHVLRKAPEVAERAIVHPHAQLRVEDQDAIVDRVEDDLPLAQVHLFDLDLGVAKAAKGLGHPGDLVAAVRGRQGGSEIAAGDRQHAVTERAEAGTQAAADVQPDDQEREHAGAAGAEQRPPGPLQGARRGACCLRTADAGRRDDLGSGRAQLLDQTQALGQQLLAPRDRLQLRAAFGKHVSRAATEPQDPLRRIPNLLELRIARVPLQNRVHSLCCAREAPLERLQIRFGLESCGDREHADDLIAEGFELLQIADAAQAFRRHPVQRARYVLMEVDRFGRRAAADQRDHHVERALELSFERREALLQLADPQRLLLGAIEGAPELLPTAVEHIGVAGPQVGELAEQLAQRLDLEQAGQGLVSLELAQLTRSNRVGRNKAPPGRVDLGFRLRSISGADRLRDVVGLDAEHQDREQSLHAHLIEVIDRLLGSLNDFPTRQRERLPLRLDGRLDRVVELKVLMDQPLDLHARLSSEQEPPLNVVRLSLEHRRNLAGQDVQMPDAVRIIAELRQLLHTGLQLGQMSVQPLAAGR